MRTTLKLVFHAAVLGAFTSRVKLKERVRGRLLLKEPSIIEMLLERKGELFVKKAR